MLLKNSALVNEASKVVKQNTCSVNIGVNRKGDLLKNG